MKYGFRGALLALLGIVFVTTTAFAAPLNLDRTHSKVGFTAETLLFDVDGQFGEYTVEVEGDKSKPATAKIKVTLQVASIDTQNQKRDDHLRSPDFFDAEKHPTITFASTSIRPKGNQLIVKGNLTMRGTTKPVTIPFKVAKGKNGAGVDTTTYKGKVTIDRNDFGVGSDSIAAKISLEDEVDLKLLVVTFD
ncbi:MAG: YceI family protein [Myxococcales bacterium]|nr:YceI family protein [Myxococcales bacterium]MDH3484888.1 YceI family protein [Myxococcales bacterium]